MIFGKGGLISRRRRGLIDSDFTIDDCVEVNEAEIGVEDITWQEIIEEEEEQFEEQEATIGVENISWEEVV